MQRVFCHFKNRRFLLLCTSSPSTTPFPEKKKCVVEGEEEGPNIFQLTQNIWNDVLAAAQSKTGAYAVYQ